MTYVGRTKEISAIPITLLMATTGLMYMTEVSAGSQVNGMSYSVGDSFVTFSGTHVSLHVGGERYSVYWNVIMESGTFMNYFIPTSHSYSIINNSAQDSAVLMESNGMVNVTQIYSFTNGTIDASLAIQNVNLYNTTFYSSFSIFTRYSRYVDLNGFSPETQVMVDGMSGMQVSAVPSTDCEASVGNISVNWMSELSIFQGGLIYSGNSMDVLVLPFRPISIPENETYSIDPVITPVTPLQPLSSNNVAVISQINYEHIFGIPPPSPYPTIDSFTIAIGATGLPSHGGYDGFPSWLHTIPGTTPVYFNGSAYLGDQDAGTVIIYGITNETNEPTYQELASRYVSASSPYSAVKFSIYWSAQPGIYVGFLRLSSNQEGDRATGLSITIWASGRGARIVQIARVLHIKTYSQVTGHSLVILEVRLL